MEKGNQSTVMEFLLLGLSTKPEYQQLFFLLFLHMYLITVLGNLVIILVITGDPQLHIPMYFFLSNLSFVDICFTSNTVPKMLVSHIKGTKTIAYGGCLTQMYFFAVFGDLENFLLALMAYDRFVAVCHPLHYATKMTHLLCTLLTVGSWIVAILNALMHTLLMAHLNFCANNIIPNFFCDVSPLLKLSCSDPSLNEMVIFIEGGLITITPFICILASYIHIASAVLRIPSMKGKWKVFSTCGSHLAVVSLFYGTIIAVYLNPSSTHSIQKDIAATVMYTVVTPMLNPFIYTLRNQDIKRSLIKKIGRKRFSV